jgi:Tol biopolymer transport system component
MAKTINHLGALAAVVGLLAAVGVLVLMLVLSEAGPAEATFPGKNGKIAYETIDVIYTSNPDGSGKTKATRGTAPSFSADGKKIVYTSWSGPTDSELYIINANGGGRTRVTNNSENDLYPSFSPAGKRIVYTSYDGTDWEIYTNKAGGGGKRKLTHNKKDDAYPTYSPDGKRIAYVSYDGTDWEIYTINVGGGGRRKLTHNKKDDFGPSYSPDGKRLAYSGWSGVEGDDQVARSNIYTIKVGGGSRVKVTDNNIGRSESTSWGSRP